MTCPFIIVSVASTTNIVVFNGSLPISPRYIPTLQVTLIISLQGSYAAMSTHGGASQAGSDRRATSRFGGAELLSINVSTYAARVTSRSRGSQVGSQVEVTEEDQEPDSHETARVSLVVPHPGNDHGLSADHRSPYQPAPCALRVKSREVEVPDPSILDHRQRT